MRTIDLEMMTAEELRDALKHAEAATNIAAHLAEKAAHPDQVQLDANQSADLAAKFFAQCHKLDAVYEAAADLRLLAPDNRPVRH